MKLIYCLFSIYLILLSCLPCLDMDKGVSVYSCQEISSKLDNHSHEKKGDTCSPFCVCNCCASHSFITNLTYHFLDGKKDIDIKLPEYKSLLVSCFYTCIWQPPKINDII